MGWNWECCCCNGESCAWEWEEFGGWATCTWSLSYPICCCCSCWAGVVLLDESEYSGSEVLLRLPAV